MQLKTQVTVHVQYIIYTWLAMILCFVCQPASGQNPTAEDSAAYRKGLAGSRSDIDRINFELKLAEYSIRKPGTFKPDLDNARMWIDKAEALNAHLKSGQAATSILFEESYLQEEYSRGGTTKGKAMLLKLIPLLQNGPDKYRLGVAYKALSFYYNSDTKEQYNTKIDLLNKSIAMFKQCGDQFKVANTLQYLADLDILANNFQLALRAMNESLTAYNSIQFKQIQGLYDLFGQVYFAQDDYNNGLHYQLLALQTSNQLKDSSMQACEINNHIGMTLTSLKQMKRAIPYFKTALKLAEKNKDLNGIFELASNIADAWMKLKEPEKAVQMLDEAIVRYKEPRDNDERSFIDSRYVFALAAMKQRDRARSYTEDMVRISNLPAINKNDLTDIYSSLIDCYFTLQDYNSELIFLVKNQKLAAEMGDPTVRLNNLSAWYRLDSARKDYNAAFVHLLESKKLEDSIFDEKKSRQIGQLQVEFESQQKEDEIRIKSQDIKILTQDAKINKADLKGVQLTRNLTLGGIVIFVLITAMQYRRYREKQKLNVLITDKNRVLQKLVEEKEWLLKEVHHRVKNNLHTVICLLESQAAYLENDALKAIESSQHRIFAMSLIHQRLYMSTDIQTIDMAIYLPEFIMYLKESFGAPLNITFQQEIESIRLNVAEAIPLAIIVNEAVTNSIKYAFPDERPGVIKITLAHRKDLVRLIIEDNGTGITGSIEPGELSSLGLELIRGLTNDLKGNVEFRVANGTTVIVVFKRDVLGHRI